MDDTRPNDIAYTYSGYAPLSIRLVQQALKGAWKNIDEIMKGLPGAAFEWRQSADGGSYTADASGLPQNFAGANEGHRPLVMVMFVGGSTFSEISSLRFLASQDSSKQDFIVATTALINGTSLLQTLADDPSL
eukprot:TRINITY_DN8957_c0_g4_i1.p1 TRINITY_DN8957_c0_g4~~TRINITY_DN8957_c0_g4_i1.p1  ORF type:complete len:152 (-),score=41.23 TRINITY_DN8957_c0_g4_i1:42-440(-)